MEQAFISVKTKFNIGDRVWLITNNKVHSSDITGIGICVESMDEFKVQYILHYESSWVDEGKLFPSKKVLIESL